MKFLKNNKMLEMAEADPNDAEAILNYLKQVGSETDFLLFGEDGVGMTVEQEKAFLEKMTQEVTSKIFVGKVEGEIVSIGGVHGSTRPKIKHHVTLSISVLKDYWHVGVATHMMNHMLNYCRMTKQIKNVSLEVMANNESAIKLYQKQGFKQVGKITSKYLIDGAYVDSLVMEIAL